MSEVASSSAAVEEPLPLSVEKPLPLLEKITCEEDPTPAKRLKTKDDSKLEKRLGGILCCTVCLDLPKSAVYQCSNGHLMCAGCFTHILADARIRDETSTCPNCRVEISRTLATRNLAVEKAVSELPADCRFCGQKHPRHSLERHETDTCDERTVRCQYYLLGCGWYGPHHEISTHEQQCQQPSYTGTQILPHLRRQAESIAEQNKIFKSIYSILSLEKITFNDLNLKPYRTDEFIHKLFYETSRFSALNNQWVIKAFLNDNQRDPHLTTKRYLSYQLISKGKLTNPMNVHFMILRGPFGDVMKVEPHTCQAEFTEAVSESQFFSLPLIDENECNKLLAARSIEFRLMMALLPK